MRIVDVDENIINKLRDSGLTDMIKSFALCDFLLLEEQDGKIIGVGGIGGLFHITSLEIVNSYQGKGLGKIMFDKLINETKKRGYSFISGFRDPENVRVIKIENNQGWKPIFRIHYSSNMIREIVFLVLKPRGNIVAGFLSAFNNIIGIALLACVLKITKPLFKNVLAYTPKEVPNLSIKLAIKNFKKI